MPRRGRKGRLKAGCGQHCPPHKCHAHFVSQLDLGPGTNFVVLAVPKLWSSSLIRGQSILHGPAKLEDRIEAGDAETLAHVALGPRHPKLAAAFRYFIQAIDETPDTGAVDALHPGHVEDDAPQSLRESAVQHRLDLLPLRPAHDVACERDHRGRGRHLFLIDFQCHLSAVPHQYMPDGSFWGGRPYTG